MRPAFGEDRSDLRVLAQLGRQRRTQAADYDAKPVFAVLPLQ